MTHNADVRPEAVMSFGEHLEELRTRVVIGLLGLVPILVVAAAFGRKILEFLIEPAQHALKEADLPASLQATSPLESFAAYMRVVIIVTVLVGAPWLILQLWKFVSPGLHQHERRFGYLLMPMSVVLTVAGTTFMYYIMLPVVLNFFITFGSTVGQTNTISAPLPPEVTLPSIPVLPNDPESPAVGSMWINENLQQLRIKVGGDDKKDVLGVTLSRSAGIVQQYRISEYIKMIFSFTLAFAVGFQMPIVVLLLGWAGLVNPAMLVKYRKHSIFACALAGAILTPADPLSMLMLAGPLYLLFELGVLLLRVLPADRVARGFSREGPDAGDE